MSQYLGDISAYALAVSQGYTGTEEEYAELMASYATVGQTAVDAKDAAVAAKTAAQTAETTATNKATEATTAATTATTKAGEASTSASTATSAKDTAVSAASTATTKATEATTAAATATSAATTATTAKDDAVSAKTAAQTAQTGAETAAASVSASAEQIATNAADISQLKSDFADMQSDGAVPSAEQILSDKGVTDCVPYHYRKTGGDGADRLYDQIVGGSLAVNQLAPTYSKAGNGTTPFASGTAITKGHKVFMSYKRDSNTAASFLGIYVNEAGTATNFSLALASGGALSGATIKNAPASGVSNGTGSNVAGNAWMYQESTPTITDLMLIDLTQMFGTTIADYVYGLETATAGAGVAWLKANFPRIFNAGYIPYNAGELVSVQASAHKMVGFNQWDEEWVNGYYNINGSWQTDTGIVSSKNPIRVMPNTTYYFHTSATAFMYVTYWKEAAQSGTSSTGQFIERSQSVANKTFTTPANCNYIHFNCGSTYGTTYNNDICVNISSSRNGEYEPYEEHSYPLDNSLELRGLPKLDADNNLVYDGDVYESTGNVTRRYGIVDLGTLTWTYSSERQWFNTVQNPFPAKFPAYNTDVANIVCAKYPPVSNIYMRDTDPTVIACSMNNSGFFIVRDTAYTDATAFKTAMSGVMLVYELATPTTEEAEPYQHLQQCDPNGTEEYVSTGIVPIGHNSFYPENLRAKVEGLPWNFASLIAPTEATFTATRNYTTGSLFIVDNVLYKATSNIANGGTITPNTNCTATTLAEIISALA